MAKFTKAITDSGIALLSSLLEGEKITFTKAVLSETPISNLNTPPTLIENAVGTNIKCVLDSLNPNKVLLEARVPSHAIKASFSFNSYAIYAKKESSQEVIFYCATTASPDTLTSQDAMEQSLVIGVDIELSREANVTVNVNNDLVWVTYHDLEAHTGNKNNPHAVTKEQVGLGKVQNYAISNDLTDSKESYASSFVVYKLGEYLGQALQLHTESKHTWTKEDIGLGEVQNYGKATLGDTESDSSYSTPMTVQHQIENSLKPLDEKIINIIRKDSLKVDDTMTLVSDLEGNLTLGVKPKKTGFKDLEGSPNENENLKQVLATKLQATDIITNGNITMSRNGNQITLSVNVPNIPQGSDINAEVIKILAQKIDIDKVADVIRSMSSALLVTKQGNLAQLTLDLSKDQNITQINTQLQSLKKQIEAIKPNTGGGSSGESGGGNNPSIDLEALDKRYIQPLVAPLNAQGNPYWSRKEGEQIVPLNLIQVTAELDKITDNHTQEIATLKKSSVEFKKNCIAAIQAVDKDTTVNEDSTNMDVVNGILDIKGGGEKYEYYEPLTPLKEIFTSNWVVTNCLNLRISMFKSAFGFRGHRLEPDGTFTELQLKESDLLGFAYPISSLCCSKTYLVIQDKSKLPYLFKLVGDTYVKVESNLATVVGASEITLTYDDNYASVCPYSRSFYKRIEGTDNFEAKGIDTSLSRSMGKPQYCISVSDSNQVAYYTTEWKIINTGVGCSMHGKYWGCNGTNLFLYNEATDTFETVTGIKKAYQISEGVLIALSNYEVRKYSLTANGCTLLKTFKLKCMGEYLTSVTGCCNDYVISTDVNNFSYMKLNETESVLDVDLNALNFPIWQKSKDRECIYTLFAEPCEGATTVRVVVIDIVSPLPVIYDVTFTNNESSFATSQIQVTNGMLHLNILKESTKQWYHLRLSDNKWINCSADNLSGSSLVCTNEDCTLLKAGAYVYKLEGDTYVRCETQPSSSATFTFNLKLFRQSANLWKYDKKVGDYIKSTLEVPVTPSGSTNYLIIDDLLYKLNEDTLLPLCLDRKFVHTTSIKFRNDDLLMGIAGNRMICYSTELREVAIASPITVGTQDLASLDTILSLSSSKATILKLKSK